MNKIKIKCAQEGAYRSKKRLICKNVKNWGGEVETTQINNFFFEKHNDFIEYILQFFHSKIKFYSILKNYWRILKKSFFFLVNSKKLKNPLKK